MKFFNRRMGYGLALFGLSLMCAALPARAEDVDDLEKQSDQLEAELDDLNEEIADLASDIASSEVALEETDGEIEKTQEQLLIAQASEQKQYEDMKDRIKYLYENDDDSFLSLVLGAEDMDDLLNKVDFVQSVNEYDRQMLTELVTIRETIESQEEHLQSEQTEQQEMQEQLTEKKASLSAKAKETSTDINEVNEKIETLKEQERKAAEEAAKKEAEEEAAKEAEKEAKKSSNSSDSSSKKSSKKSSSKKSSSKKSSDSSSDSSSESSSSSSDVSANDKISNNSGALTKSKGVVYYNGHRETYYSQKVLPGTGLKIPGRHVAADGTIRDQDGYICVASSDLAKGTVVETSLGPGKVYDSGCASGTIDLYTNW